MKKILFAGLFILIGFAASAQTSFKGNVTQIMNAGRIVDLQKITAADLPYTKGNGAPFSILIVPKATDNYTEVEKVTGRMYQGDNNIEIPILVNTWNSTAMVNLSNVSQNVNLFTFYDVYIGFGQNIDDL